MIRIEHVDTPRSIICFTTPIRVAGKDFRRGCGLLLAELAAVEIYKKIVEKNDRHRSFCLHRQFRNCQPASRRWRHGCGRISNHATDLLYICDGLNSLLARSATGKNSIRRPTSASVNATRAGGERQVVTCFSGGHYHLRTFTRWIYRWQTSFRQIRTQNRIISTLLVLGAARLDHARPGLSLSLSVRSPEIWPPLLPHAFPGFMVHDARRVGTLASFKQKQPECRFCIHLRAEQLRSPDAGHLVKPDFLAGPILIQRVQRRFAA